MKETASSPISQVLKNVFEGLETRKTVSREEVGERWKGIAGDAASKHSGPVSMRNGVLTVCVDSSSWMQELNFRKRNILKGLKKTFGKDRISEIRFKIGEF